MLEFVDHLHEHFKHPVVMRSGHYMPPTVHVRSLPSDVSLLLLQDAGYSVEMFPASLDQYEYPTGSAWQQLFASGKFKRPE